MPQWSMINALVITQSTASRLVRWLWPMPSRIPATANFTSSRRSQSPLDFDEQLRVAQAHTSPWSARTCPRTRCEECLPRLASDAQSLPMIWALKQNTTRYPRAPPARSCAPGRAERTAAPLRCSSESHALPARIEVQCRLVRRSDSASRLGSAVTGVAHLERDQLAPTFSSISGLPRQDSPGIMRHLRSF